MIPQSIRDLVAAAPAAHLTTVNEDGSPQVTVVWVGIEDDEFVIGHMSEHQKIKNIRRDARVCLSMLAPSHNELGMQDYLVVYGTARVTDGGAVELLQNLARLYVSPHADFPPTALRDRAGWITRIKPRRYTGQGPWVKAK